MDLNRRHLIGASTAGIAGALAMPADAARAAPLTSLLGRDATQYGVRPGSSEDQTRALQRAIDEAAWAQMPLALPPGVYRSGLLRLPNGSQLIGVRGATRLVFTGGTSMIQSDGSDAIGLTGITFDGGNIPLPTRRGLIHVLGGRDVRMADCQITQSGGSGIWLEQVAGDVSGNIFTNIALTAVVSFDARGSASRATPSSAPTTMASRSCAPRSATTARWSPTTASRTSRQAPVAPASTATPSTRFAPAT